MAIIRLRQVALVTHDLHASAARFRDDLGLTFEPFHDPLVDGFGLENRVFEAGDCFLELLTPRTEGSAGGRYLERRGGDAAYMAMFHVDDLDAAQAHAESLGIRVVWRGGYGDVEGLHLHPQDVPGAIVSFDWSDPPESWHWAGPRWTGSAPADRTAGGIRGITVGALDPAAMAARWAEVLELKAGGDDTIELAGQVLRFVPVPDRAEEGIAAVDLALPCDSPYQTTICRTLFDVVPA